MPVESLGKCKYLFLLLLLLLLFLLLFLPAPRNTTTMASQRPASTDLSDIGEEEGVAEGGGQVEGDQGHHEDRRADHMHLAARARVTGGGGGGEVGVVCEMARCGVSWSPSSS